MSDSQLNGLLAQGLAADDWIRVSKEGDPDDSSSSSSSGDWPLPRIPHIVGQSGLAVLTFGVILSQSGLAVLTFGCLILPVAETHRNCMACCHGRVTGASREGLG